MELNELLDYSRKNNASDIHLSASHPPMFRINGDIAVLKVPELTNKQIINMLQTIMSEEQFKEYESALDLDFAITHGEGRFRVNAFNTMNGPAAVLRNIPNKIDSLESINAPDCLKDFAMLDKGLILVTGPTGSGKSTTVAAIIDYINKNSNKHILTIEDPVEFIHKSQKSLINQREIGAQSKSFAKALKSSLREDPDVILVGELRDIETIQLALTAAETGHLVISTLHTSSAARTIDRVIDVFPPNTKEMIRVMLSSSLESVISQKLIKKLDNSGRVPAFEVLIATPAVRNLIREGQIPKLQSLIQIGSKMGMRLMKDSIFELVSNKIISEESARLALSYSESHKDTNNTHNNNNIEF